MSQNKRVSSSAKWLKDSSAVPCPSWCWGGHKGNDHPDDRTHWSRWSWNFRPVLMEPEFYQLRKDGSGLFDHCEWELQVYVRQGWRNCEPVVDIVPDLADSPVGKGLSLTLDEARKLRRALDKALVLTGSDPVAERRPRLQVVELAS